MNILLTNLRPEYHNKIAFSLGNFDVAWYAIIIMCGAIIGTLIGYFGFAKKLGMDSDTLITGLTIGVVVGIIGARLYYVLFNFRNMEIKNFWDVISPRGGGLAIHGAVLAEFIFLPIFCKVKKVDLVILLEIAMPLILLAQAVGRWGNFMNQEAFGGLVPFTGEVTNGILSDAQLQEQRTYLANHLVPEFVINRMYIAYSGAPGFTLAGYYQPTFLYESFFNLMGLVLYMALRKRVKKLYIGDGLSFYLIWYGIVRFFIELMRTDPLTIGNTGIRIAVVTSVVYVIVGLAIAIVRRVLKYRLVSCQDVFYSDGYSMILDESKEKKKTNKR